MGINDRSQGFGVKAAEVSHLDDQTRNRLEETAAVEAAAVVPWDDSVRGDRLEDVDLFGGHAAAARASDVVDLPIGFDEGCEDVFLSLDESLAIFFFHLSEEHDGSILARGA